ncbi:UNVERIFIED_CONTAM: hypothetical protein FKN15_068672 [Acipenser sinensis]
MGKASPTGFRGLLVAGLLVAVVIRGSLSSGSGRRSGLLISERMGEEEEEQTEKTRWFLPTKKRCHCSFYTLGDRRAPQTRIHSFRTIKTRVSFRCTRAVEEICTSKCYSNAMNFLRNQPCLASFLCRRLGNVSKPTQQHLEVYQFYTALNQDAMLTVNFTSNSQCDVFWRKTSKAVNSIGKLVYNHLKNMSKGGFLGPYLTRAQYYSHNNTLVLNNVNEEDEGVYEVTQECVDSAISTRMIRLSLMSPLSEPLITVSIRNTSHSMLLTLSCKVTEGTQPSYWWLKDGKPLPQDGRHFEQNSSLEVRNMTELDCVTYTCVSRNRLGSREAQRSITGERLLSHP